MVAFHPFHNKQTKMQTSQIQVTEIVPTFFAAVGLTEYDSATIVPNGYTLQGDNCHV